MIITNIPDFSIRQLEKIKNIYGGKVEVIEDLHDESACNWEEVEILLSYGKKIDAVFLDRCPNLKWIQAFQSGIERFPKEELRKRNIVLTNILGIHGIPMSEYILSTILYFARDFPRYMENQKNHFWEHNKLVGEMHGKVVGIFGAGTIGQEVAKKLNFLGMKVYGLNTSGNLKPHFEKMFKQDEKQELLKQCDYIILILPLTDKTKNFIGEKELETMKNEACLINVGRGSLINEKAFISAMKTKKIKGAALDVFVEEPLSKDSPLWDLENVIITPHAAAKTVKFLDRCIDKFKINLTNYFNNKPLNNQINLKRGY